jgi:hypothetical protein
MKEGGIKNINKKENVVFTEHIERIDVSLNQ